MAVGVIHLMTLTASLFRDGVTNKVLLQPGVEAAPNWPENPVAKWRGAQLLTCLTAMRSSRHDLLMLGLDAKGLDQWFESSGSMRCERHWTLRDVVVGPLDRSIVGNKRHAKTIRHLAHGKHAHSDDDVAGECADCPASSPNVVCLCWASRMFNSLRASALQWRDELIAVRRSTK